jgi:hypothetical protein
MGDSLEGDPSTDIIIWYVLPQINPPLPRPMSQIIEATDRSLPGLPPRNEHLGKILVPYQFGQSAASVYFVATIVDSFVF